MERREHKRFKVKNGSFAVLRSRPAIPGQMNGEHTGDAELAKLSTKLAKIIDISGNGLAFYYIDPKTRLSSIVIRRCGVQFSQLKLNQRTRLGYFLRNYTTNAATVNPCSIPIANVRLNKHPQVEYHYDLTDRKFSQPTG